MLCVKKIRTHRKCNNERKKKQTEPDLPSGENKQQNRNGNMNNQRDQGVKMFTWITYKGSNTHPEYEHRKISQRDGKWMSDSQILKFLTPVHFFKLSFCSNRI